MMDAGYEGTVYAVVAPVVNGWAFIGETDKYVTGAYKRFTSVTATSGSLIANLVGVADETVTVCVVKMSAGMTPVCKQVTFKTAGSETVTFN